MKIPANQPGLSIQRTKRLENYLLAFFLLLSGCNMLQNKETIDKQKEAVKTRIEHYESLRKAITAQTLPVGLNISEIRNLYGPPDETFSSGSSTGQFEIWTYEQISPNKENPTDLRPIRLYINNEKLVSWTF